MISIGGHTGQAGGGGAVTVDGVPAGSQIVSIQVDSLPPYLEVGAPVSVEVPQPAGSLLEIPITLPIGRNSPNVYLAFGDSISAGDGSGDGEGYRFKLALDLGNFWGRADVEDGGVGGSRSDRGAQRVGQVLNNVRPAYTLILYGTNDWNDSHCRGDGFPCYTIDSLRTMIGVARSLQSKPILATIPPVNPIFVDRLAAERNVWVEEMNVLLQEMAASENTPVADIHAAFMSQPVLSDLFSDHIHPNDDGYDLIADVFFRTITTARGAAAASWRSVPAALPWTGSLQGAASPFAPAGKERTDRRSPHVSRRSLR
jgi:lysophospholipase L1-like esterase